jgi:hypothetical protein
MNEQTRLTPDGITTPSTSETANTNTAAPIDGVEINPDRHNQTHDPDTDTTHHLAKTVEEEWIHWTHQHNATGEDSVTIHDRGYYLGLENVELDRTTVRDALRSGARHALQDADQPGVVEELQTLIDDVDTIARYAHNSWMVTSRGRVREHISDGTANLTENLIWSSTGQDAPDALFDYPPVVNSRGFEAPVVGTLILEAVYTAVTDYRSQTSPALDHAAGFTILERRP